MPYANKNTDISAIIITKDEEASISSCLKSLSGVVNQVIILDSHSKDSTIKNIEAFQNHFDDLQIHQIDWMGYAGTKNYGNSLSTNDYILSIDADEVLSEPLKQTIISLKSNGFEGVYSLNRKTWYCGKFIKHGGWYPEYKVRIFPRNSFWKGDFVHETLDYDNTLKMKILKGDLLHYSFRSISQHLDKVIRFSELASQEKIKQGKKGSVFKLIFSPWFLFIKMYIIKLGFLDGLQGFCLAIISSFDRFIREAKIIFGSLK